MLNLIPFGVDGKILERYDRVDRATATRGHDVACRTERECLLDMELDDRAAEPVMIGRHENADRARGPAQVDVVDRIGGCRRCGDLCRSMLLGESKLSEAFPEQCELPKGSRS